MYVHLTNVSVQKHGVSNSLILLPYEVNDRVHVTSQTVLYNSVDWNTITNVDTNQQHHAYPIMEGNLEAVQSITFTVHIQYTIIY